MSDLKSILNEEYHKAGEAKEETLNIKELLGMVEEVLELPISEYLAPELMEEKPDSLTEVERFSMSIPIPKLNPNEAWGDPNSQSRKDVERIFASITRQPSIQARIDHVNSFVDPARAQRKGTGQRFNAILNMMMIIEALQACLNDYSESSAGFVFEGFMAAVTGGKQISGRVGGTLPIEDFVTGDEEPVSLKLLSPNTGIHGSFTNLIDYLFIRGGSGISSIKYLIARKNSEDGENVSQLAISDFIISRDNVTSIMTATPKNAKLLGKAARAFEQHVKAWQDSPEWRLQMFEILKQCPGYTKGIGMFYKNLDAEGAFDEKGSEPPGPEKKQKQYNLSQIGNFETDAANVAERDFAAGKEPDFEGWVTKNRLQDLDIKALKKIQKAYNKAYADAAQEAQQVAESYFGSFHEREKKLMEQERLLDEAKGGDGGSQWTITRTGMKDLRKIATVEYYGELNLSNENIRAVSEIYIEKLKGDMMNLLETTKSFTENVGRYFSADRRSTAMNANRQAQAEGEEVVDLLAKSAEPAKDDSLS
jgi:hypothetical protein